MGLIVNHADERKEERRHNPVGKHLQDGAVHADERQGAEADDDVAHVADGRIPDHELQVALGHRREAP